MTVPGISSNDSMSSSMVEATLEQGSAGSDRMTSANSVAYRRNGKLFSCEPCRKGKLRCDHTTPVCGRCARRRKPEQCVYHPAPLTKKRMTTSSGGSSPRRTAFAIPAIPRHSPYPNAPQRSGLISPPLSSESAIGKSQSESLLVDKGFQITSSRIEQSTSSVSCSISTPESSMSYRDSRHGFLGPTAFTAVYTENSENMGFDDMQHEFDEAPPVLPEKIKQGAEVLTVLRNMPLFRQLARRWFDLYDGLIIPQPVVRIWYEELWDEFEKTLTQGTPAQLLRLSEQIFRNTRQPIKTHQSMSAAEWSKAATGRNIRWEVIGLILSKFGLVAVFVDDWDNDYDDIRETLGDRATFGERMRTMSERCLCFCYECEALNDIYVCFLYQDLVLVECMKGEAHYAAWQRTGELLDTVVALGLHRGNYVDAETPFWLSELRRKLFVSAFSRDKTVSSFLGRPPRLSYRYCKLEMPLDLKDEELFLEGAELETAMAQLDENGWHTSGRLSRRTWTRIWFQECLVLEEILEIALGSGDDLDERVEKVRAKLARVHQSFPPCINLTADELLTSGPAANRQDRYIRIVNAVYVVCINAGMLLTDFLLQRAVVNRSKGDTRTLIPVARKLLKVVLLAQSRRDFFKDFRGDMVYLLASYGLPSAGVLAIELLKQEQTRQHEPELLPKSETIQDLSIFIAALASVNPGEGNYNICNQGRRALKRVLDQILAPPPPAAATSTDQPILDDMYFPTSNDADFLQWLENVDWDRNLGGHEG